MRCVILTPLNLSLSLYIYMCVCVRARARVRVCVGAHICLGRTRDSHIISFPTIASIMQWLQWMKRIKEDGARNHPIYMKTNHTHSKVWRKKKKTLRKLCYFVNFSEFWLKHRKSLIRRAPHWYIVFRPGLD